MRKRVVTTAAILAAVVVLWLLSWPPSPKSPSGSPDPQFQQHTVAGVVHVHSTQSDGSGARGEIAAAAARAGLRFVVFTDHGDGTRQPEPPTYSSGVLCIDAVEISTNSGHYVALGLGAAPYRLGGEAAAVVEDVRRLGGFGIVAHPDSPKPALAWRDWSLEADGVEWLNADSEWRNESWPSLARTLFGYLARPAPALASILDREAATLDRWDAVTARRQMPAFGATDAHGGPGRSKQEAGRFSLPSVPSYEASFRSFSQRVILRSPFTGGASADAADLLEALRAGRTYTTLDAIAAPAWVEFAAHRGGHAARMGERLEGEGPASLFVRAPTLAGATITVLRNGSVAQTGSGEVSTTTSGPGAYRVEVRIADRGTRAPWIFSNPIYVDLPPASTERPGLEPREVLPLQQADWGIERDPSTTAAVVREGGLTGMTFQLGQTAVSPFAALSTALPRPAPAFDAVVADIFSDSPARISVQLRSNDGSARWTKSMYVGPGAATTVLRTSEFAPAERDGRTFDAGDAGWVLLVADLVNSRPGATGRLTVRRFALARMPQ
jgi:hypothetical protein